MVVLRIAVAAVALAVATPSPAQAPAPNSADTTASELLGLWRAVRRFGPDERGVLLMERREDGWVADFHGWRIPVTQHGGVLSFAVPGGRGSFRARLNAGGGLVNGQWFQPSSPVAPAFGTGIRFQPDGPARWRGEVLPVEDAFTLYLMVERRADGTVGAFIRNPDRNIGINLGVDRLEREGESVRLIGRRPGRPSPEPVMSGSFDAGSGVLRLYLRERGGTYDFRREGDHSHFWPRGRNPGQYTYEPPAALGDGWPVGTLEEAGVDSGAIEAFIQMILDTPMSSVNAPEVHGILIARSGRLVLEEYFHGYDRDRLHDTRSASKSLTATLVGAALENSPRFHLDDPVYRIMNGGRFPAELEARKRAMTLEHLLMMSSGIHCDDGAPDAPGNEDGMLDQEEEPDFYRYYMGMPMDRDPGERSIYCSGDPNLALGVMSRATSEHPMDLFDRLLGAPLGIRRHGWYLSPSLQPYGGGSVQISPRDFMKMGQLMLNGGTWNGRRILPEWFVQRASSPLCPLNRVGYGYLWWVADFPYGERQVRGYWAGGNGGQGVMVVPELDMVVATFGGSYGTQVGLEIQQAYPARWIIPAARRDDDRRTRVDVPAPFELTYGRQRPAPACSR
ncbi:MAG TPA: serine hydrolase [Longimicrobium sp.]|jgi:CubicO group peptidase (beta-lactamase class C family)|uniref:serine hydrolase domain-containing protein n=1 Tax=Longimicrobium sp. TaxID=2029185 RepID=UPI002ED8840B